MREKSNIPAIPKIIRHPVCLFLKNQPKNRPRKRAPNMIINWLGLR
jgi:hypothetical protein